MFCLKRLPFLQHVEESKLKLEVLSFSNAMVDCVVGSYLRASNTVIDHAPYSRGTFSGYGRISGFRYFTESGKNGFETHFECELSPFRIQTLTWSHPCPCVDVIPEQMPTIDCALLVLRWAKAVHKP